MITDVIRQQASDLMVQALQELAPSMDLRPGTPQYDLYINPFLAEMSAIIDQNQQVETRRNAAADQWAGLTTAEADAEAKRYFTDRFLGGKSVGSVRLKFKRAIDVNLNPGNKLTIGTLIYHPQQAFSVAAQSLTQDNVLGLFYTDIVIQADQNGNTYDQSPGTKVTIDVFATDANLIEAVTIGPVVGGYPDETNQEMYARIQRNQTVRNLVNPLSIEAVLRDNFTDIVRRVQVVGFQEPEMLRDQVAVIDQVLGVPLTLRLGGRIDVYVQTPIVRQTIEVELPAGQSTIDLSPWRALLKIHGVRDKVDATATPFYALVNVDPATRYSGIDGVQLYIDPGLSGRTLQLDISYAPDIMAIQDYTQSASVRLSCADLLVRFFVPVWLSGNIYVQGGIGLEASIGQAITAYLDGLTGEQTVVVSKITEAIHSVGTAMVFQDYEISSEVAVDGGPSVITNTSTTLSLQPNYAKGFSPRVALYINEGILVTAIS